MAGEPLGQARPLARGFVYAYATCVAALLVPIGYLAVTGDDLGTMATALVAAGFLVGIFVAVRGDQPSAGHAACLLTGILVLVMLPTLGVELDAMAESCRERPHHCEPVYQPLALPEVYGLFLLQAAAASAFFLSRSRPEALSPRAEAAIAAGLSSGVLLHVVLAVQLAVDAPYALLVIWLPVLTPYATIPLLATELVRRLRARGREARDGARIHAPTLLLGLAGTPLLLGLYAIVMAALLGRPTGAIDTFLSTCGHPLSALKAPPEQSCHYLCTIAARGSPSLVKPLRWGVRRGTAVLVNRQLAVANAFEDLLVERWPRLGRLARRVYDALALPLCELLCRRRWVANVVYIAMKPAEWGFYLTLLLLDPGSPEARIDRMYRPTRR